MRVVLDTNILVSALIAPAGNPAAIYNVWEQGKFTLPTCPEHAGTGLVYRWAVELCYSDVLAGRELSLKQAARGAQPG